MDNPTRPETDKKVEPTRRHSRVALGILYVLIALGLVIVVDTIDLGGVSRVIDRVGVLPLCVYDQGDCQPCYGPSCLSEPRGTPGPCFGRTGQAFSDCFSESMNYAQPPVRACRRVLGFMCVELQTGPE